MSVIETGASPQGLAPEEAAERLRQDGPNELPQDQRRKLPRIARDAMREPMLQLLLAAGFIYLILGNMSEALILIAFALLNVIMVVVQETRTETALAALRELAAPKAVVWRAGQKLNVPARELVVGDIIGLVEGERVPADSVLLGAENLQTDESLLTGESVPVRKRAVAGDEPPNVPGGEDQPFLWGGSLVTSGSGLARVTATGAATAIGRIGHSLGEVETAPSPLQTQTRRLVWLFAVAGLGACVLLTVAYGLLHGEWLQAALAGITLAMAAMPEEFPLVLTIFMVLGAWRMSQRRVLARRLAAIEALGSATMLCTDKTGTLTQNRMEVARLKAGSETLRLSGETGELPEAFHELVEFAILASRPQSSDPMEAAFLRLGERNLANTEHLHQTWSIAHNYPLAPEMLAMSQVWQSEQGDVYVIATKGAPEAVVDLCHMDRVAIAAVLRDVTAMAEDGLRVLAVARSVHAGTGWPENQHDFDFTFLGLVGLADPLRPGVPEAVEACRRAGIAVAMITGDHPATALAIARQAGIEAEGVLTGAELAALNEDALKKALAKIRVFARVMPEQKLLLVRGFVANGEVVAMTGDGVNDAPALKAAHIGVAMGGRGTDVAREAASLVLLDDDFTSLVSAIRLGRRIDSNLRKAFAYVLAVHAPIVGMSLIPVLLGWAPLLGPVHVVFLEMIIDPASSIVFEAERASQDAMSRPPRPPGAPLFTAGLLGRGLLQGVVVLAAAMAVFFVSASQGNNETVGRAMAFITLVLGNLGLILSNKSLEGGDSTMVALLRPNRPLGIVAGIAILALTLSLLVPELRHLFAFSPPRPSEIAFAAGAAVTSLAVNEVILRFWRLPGREGGACTART